MGAGRPSKYKPEYAEQARKLCLLGATDEEMASFFEVCVATVNTWKEEYPEFLEAIKSGKVIADAEITDRLFKRATGYSHPDIDIRVIDGSIVETPLIKHYPPDTAAAIFWLKNRQKDKWRDKVQTEHSGAIQVQDMTDDELDRRIAQLVQERES